MNDFLLTPEIVTALLIVLWLSGFSAGFGKILFWTAIVARSLYRVDHFIDFLSTRQGLRLLIHPVGIADFLVALMLLVLFQSYDPTSIVWIQFTVLSISIYIWHTIWYLSSQVVTPQLPQWEFKTVILIFGSFALSIITLIIPHLFIDFPSVISIALFQVFIPLYGWCILGTLSPFLSFFDRSRLHKAHALIALYEPAVIMLAGSYGKSTTKAYLEHILSGSFSVLSTNGHGESHHEIAHTVLEKLTPEHQIFIAELQANFKGDIVKACAIAPPIISIITEIDPAYSIISHDSVEKNIFYESVTALPSNGVAILNRDDQQSMEMATIAQGSVRTKFFSTTDIAHVYATDIFVQRDSVSFLLHIGDEKRLVRAPLFGKQVVYSILAASAVAAHLGLSIDLIVKKIEDSHVTDYDMTTFYGLNHALVIDNVNGRSPSELQSAIDYLSIYSDKQKLIVTDDSLHYFTDDGIDSNVIMTTKKPQSVITFLRQTLTPDYAILLQGDVSKKIQQAVQQK